MGAPKYITVPGPVDDSVSLSNLSAPGGPVTITASMQNTGNVHGDFRGNSPLTVDAPGTAASFPGFEVTRGAVLLLGFWFFRRGYRASVREAALAMNSSARGDA